MRLALFLHLLHLAVDLTLAAGCDQTAAAGGDGECSEDGFPFRLASYSLELRSHAGVDFGRSFSHPFVLSLANGTLDPATFKFYQMQDARYLEALSDAASLIATRSANVTSKLWWVDASRLALLVERSLHLNYGAKFGYGPAADIAALTLTPTNRAYQVRPALRPFCAATASAHLLLAAYGVRRT